MTNDPFNTPGDPPNPFAQQNGGSANPAVNPYAPTTDTSATHGLDSDVESIRRTYLKHEASIKSIGTLYMIPGVFLVIAFVISIFAALAAALDGPMGDDEMIALTIILAVYGGIGALQIYIGMGLRKLKQPARVIATILAAIGLLGIPFGTLISVYILYLLHSEKGQYVFSEDYAKVMAATPHIKYKSSFIVILLACILLVVVVLIFGLAFLGA